MGRVELWGNPFKQSSSFGSEIDFLASVPIFDGLSKRHIARLHDLMHLRRFTEGETVIRQGDPGVGMYIIRDGTVEVWAENPDLTRLKINELGAGDFFGEIALLNDSPRSATVVCTDKATLFGLFRSDLMSLMDANPSLGLKLIYRIAQIIAERLRLISQHTGG